MPKKSLGKTKNLWQDMDQFSRNVLSGEYTSSSDNLGFALLPISEENNHQEEKLANTPKEGNEDSDSEEIAMGTQAEKYDDNVDDLNPASAGTQTGRARGSRYFYPNLPTISEEQTEGAAFLDASPSGEESDDAELSESKDTEDMFPFPLDVCLYLEQKCLMTKQMFSKYVSDGERRQVEMVYRGLKSSVMVCGSAATLHLCTKNQIWMEQFYGVPAVVLERGSTNKLWLYLAERGTGLPLWRETIDWQSAYTRESSTYHVMYVANSRSEKMGLNFDCETAATAFWAHISRLTSQLENSAMSLPHSCTSPLDKKEISLPCFFEHLTSMQPEDCRRFLSLQCCCRDHNVGEQDENANIVSE